MKFSLILILFTLSSQAHEGGGVAGNGDGNFFSAILAHLEANNNNCKALPPQLQIKVEEACRTLESKAMLSSKTADVLFTQDQYRFFELCCQPDQI